MPCECNDRLSRGAAGDGRWLFIHIAFLTGFRNRAGAILSWCAAFSRDARLERCFTARQVGRVQDGYQQLSADPAAPRRGS